MTYDESSWLEPQSEQDEPILISRVVGIEEHDGSQLTSHHLFEVDRLQDSDALNGVETHPPGWCAFAPLVPKIVAIVRQAGLVAAGGILAGVAYRRC